MNDEVMIDVIDIDGKEFFLVNKVDEYHFFAETEHPDNICILKEKIDNGESNFVALDDEDEVDKALFLYNEKFGKIDN